MRRSAAAAACAFGLLVTACPLPVASDGLVALLERCAEANAQATLVEGARKLDQGLHAEALERFAALIPENPSCARVAVLARRALSLDRSPGADARLAAFRDVYARRRRADGAEAPSAAGTAFGLALFAPGARERRGWLIRALEHEPYHYYALALLAEELLIDGRLEEARERARLAVTLDSHLAEAWLLLARIYEEEGFFRTAASHYEVYLGLRPLDRGAALNYARMLIRSLRDGKRAEAVVRELREADPESVEVGLHFAAVHWLLGRHREAEKVYKNLLRAHPGEARCALNLGNLYRDPLAKPVDALQVYRYFLSLPLSEDPNAMLAQLLFVRSRVKDLEKELGERGIELPSPPASIEEILELGGTDRA